MTFGEKKNDKLASPSISHSERVELRSDSDLIRACLKGEESAWKELVNRYARLVYSIPRRYGLSPLDSDDVFQNVFTIAVRRLSSLRDQERLAPWLITITHRETLRLARRVKGSAELDEWAEDDEAPLHEQAQTWERQNLVHRALDQLGSPCRDLLTALFLDSSPQSYERIAARLGIPVGSIGPNRARCFRKLEAILKALGIDSGS